MGSQVSFTVTGVIPPKKDGAASVWRKAAGIQQLKKLRTAAVEAMNGRAPFDEPVQLVLRVYVPAAEGPPTLWMRRRHGDLDNFITGVCDGLQPADPRAFDSHAWTDVPHEARPTQAVCFTDDSWIRRIEAELCETDSSDLSYEVTVSGVAA